MKKIKTIALIVFALILLTILKSQSQNWQLVWSEEFDGTSLNTATWNTEIGNGIGGWGTGQVDCSLAKNVVVSGGFLTLNIKKENVSGPAAYYDSKGAVQHYTGNFKYSSGRINSKANYSFKYGMIETRCKIPAGQGIGAAFWMLGSNTDIVVWPKCGEIDILETNGDKIYINNSTVHFQFTGTDKNFYHGSIGKSITQAADLTNTFHNYKLIWVQDTVAMYFDNTLVNKIKTSDLYGAANPFNASDFYIILSTGVGSQFSGTVIDDTKLPTAMVVDYVRVYRDANKVIHIPGKVEAENYTSELGTNAETCTDAGGGFDQAYIDATDWIKYDVIVDQDANYKVTYRTAGTGVGEIQLKSNGVLLNTKSIPATGAWTTWKDVVTYVHLPKGETTLQTYFSKGGLNLNNINFEIYTGTMPNAVETIFDDSKTKIFPNPVKDILTIQSEIRTETQVEIIDINGRIVIANVYPNAESINIDFSNLDMGMYFIKLINNDQVKVEKIIHQ